MAKRILNVVTNVGHYDESSHPTGLWCPSSPTPGTSSKRPASSRPSSARRAGPRPSSRGRSSSRTLTRPQGHGVPIPPRCSLLENTASPDQIDSSDYDAIYFTGGHAAMYDFPESEGLQRITREIFEGNGIVSSVCHGYCGLLNTRLSDGSHLVAGRKITGFAWQEEVLARVNKLVPYNAEDEMKKRGALYKKAKLPFLSYAVVDGNLVTGQNPG